MPRERSTVREQILESALRLLREFGVKKLAQPQVARAAGVPQGHLTYYFPRKFDLLVAVVERFMQKLDDDLRGAVDREKFSAERGDVPLRRRVADLASVLIKDKQRTRMLLGIIVEADTDPALREGLLRGVTFTKNVLARVLERQVDDPDVEIALALFLGLGLLNLAHAGTRSDSQTDAMLDRLEHWVKCASAPSEGAPSPASSSHPESAV